MIYGFSEVTFCSFASYNAYDGVNKESLLNSFAKNTNFAAFRRSAQGEVVKA